MKGLKISLEFSTLIRNLWIIIRALQHIQRERKTIMFEITSETLEWAYKKLKCYYYYYKGSNYIKEKIIEFDKKLDGDSLVFYEMAESLNRQVDSSNWVSLTSDCSYVVYPKKNAFVQDKGKIRIDKYNTFIDLPIEYFLVDVLFCLNIIETTEQKKTAFAFIPSPHFDITEDMLHNKYIFDYYWDGYKKWMNIPSNSYLNDEKSPRVVVKMDLKECFYNSEFNFKELINELGIKNNVSLIMGSIYRSYSAKVLGDKYDTAKMRDHAILPVGLLSSSVLLNYLLSDYDEEINALNGVISYGRYVDDMYVVFKVDRAYSFDEISNKYLSGIIECNDDKYSMKASGWIKKNLPINSSKISVRYLDEKNHPDKYWMNYEIASFIDVLESQELDDITIKINDSDIQYTRSIIQNYNPQDYNKIRKSFLNLTTCDLLNSYSLWMDIFRIVKENEDEETYSTLKSRIENSCQIISCYTNETYDSSMTNKLIEQLEYELKYSDIYCNVDSADVAYLFNIKGNDIYDLLDRAINKGNDRLPFNVSIAEISLFYSLYNKSIDNDIQSFVIENYMKLNGLLDISNYKVSVCTLYEEDRLLTLKNNNRDSGKHRVCIACIPMHHFETIKEYSDWYGTLSKVSFFDVNRVIDEASRNKCEYVIFPEFSLNKDEIWQIIKLCSKKHISLICGIDHFNDENRTYNLCCIFDRITNLVFLKPKNYLPIMERMITENVGYKSFEPCDKKYLIVEDGDLFYSAMTCYEATNILDRALLAGKINCLFMPVYNRDTKYFSNIVESFSRDASAYVVQANCNGYGDSRIRKPSKDVCADVVRTKGGENVFCIIGELDIETLKLCNDGYLNAYSHCTDYDNNKIKPLSAGNICCLTDL